MTNQIRVLNGQTQSDSSFVLSGVFWLSTPANAQSPKPTFQSQDPNIDSTTLLNLRLGTITEQGFTTGAYASGTNIATVESDLQSKYTTAQTTLNNTNPALNSLIGLTYDGSSWATPTPATFFLTLPIYNNMDWASAMGRIPGVSYGRPTGYVSTSATSGKAIRATTYAPQGANAQRSVNSTSASDSSASTGAKTVTLTYLNTSFQLKTEIITLSGTTAVPTTNTDIAFVESISVTTVGTQGGGNIGTIQLWTANNGTGSIWASIAASDNVTYYAHHYVPTGVTCYILNAHGGATAVAGAFTLNRSGNPLSVTAPQIGIGGTFPYVSAGSEDHNYRIPIAIPGPDLIWIVTRPTSSTASTSYGTFEYVEF